LLIVEHGNNLNSRLKCYPENNTGSETTIYMYTCTVFNVRYILLNELKSKG